MVSACTYLFCTSQYSNISMNKAHMHFPDPPILFKGPCPRWCIRWCCTMRAAGGNGGIFWGIWQSSGAQRLYAWLETQL